MKTLSTLTLLALCNVCLAFDLCNAPVGGSPAPDFRIVDDASDGRYSVVWGAVAEGFGTSCGPIMHTLRESANGGQSWTIAGQFLQVQTSSEYRWDVPPEGRDAGGYLYELSTCISLPPLISAQPVCLRPQEILAKVGGVDVPDPPSGIDIPNGVDIDGSFTVALGESPGVGVQYRLYERARPLDGSAAEWSGFVLVHEGVSREVLREGLPDGFYQYFGRAGDAGGWSTKEEGSGTKAVVRQGTAAAWTPPGNSLVPDAPYTAPSVPTGDTGMSSVGRLDAEAEVAGGAARYRIPIKVPPGRKGMQPEVALQYNSASGNGIAGVGWSLQAASRITRCGPTAANDVVGAAVTFDASRDRLCLDGRRLVPTIGLYGNSGTVYRTELDQFVRVTQMSGGMNAAGVWFEVRTKDGRIRKYGSSEQSRFKDHGRSAARAWGLEDERDQSGNTIRYTYTAYGHGEKHLTKISYTGHQGSVGNRSVTFQYAIRPDQSMAYVAGHRRSNRYRLFRVLTQYGSSKIRRYDLTYGSVSASSSRSLLRSVRECAGKFSDQCFPPTTFEWQEATPAFAHEELTFFNSSGTPVKKFDNERFVHTIMPHGDGNGDGVKDWPGFYANAEGELLPGAGAADIANCYQPHNSVRWVCLEFDFDMDGRTDSFRHSGDKLHIKRASSSTWINTGIPWASPGSATGDSPKAFADFNGDGWVDLAIRHSGRLYVYLHSKVANPNLNPYTSGRVIWTYSITPTPSGDRFTETIDTHGDMDGNGIPDFVVSRHRISAQYPHGLPYPETLIFLHPSSDASTTTREITDDTGWTSLSQQGKRDTNFLWHDVNGDGLQDLIKVPGQSGMQLKLNTGTAFSSWQGIGVSLPTYVLWEETGPFEWVTHTYPVMSKLLTMDYDGDGLNELLYASRTDVIASGCFLIFEADFPEGQWRCDEEQYEGYKPSKRATFQQQIRSDITDASVRRYRAIQFTSAADGTVTGSSFNTEIIASATQVAVIDATGDGLPDVVSTLGCRIDLEDRCKFNQDASGISGTTVNPMFKKGAWISRNLGAAAAGERYAGHDLLAGVVDGYGASNEWEYRPLSSDEYDTDRPVAASNSSFYALDHDTLADDPDYFHFASSMYVVAEHRMSNGVGGLNKTLYRYRGATYNNKGRGYQGFLAVIRETDLFSGADDDKDIVARTNFLQKWPVSGLVETTCTWSADRKYFDDDANCGSPSQRPVLKAVINRDRQISTAVGAVFVVIDKTTEKNYDPASAVRLSTKSTERIFDSCGNVTSETRNHVDRWVDGSDWTDARTTEAWTYSCDTGPNWWLDKLLNRTLTHSPIAARHPDSPVVKPDLDEETSVTTTINSYNLPHRIPRTVTTTASDSTLSRIVTTSLNAYGLVSSVETDDGAGGLAARESRTTAWTSNGTTSSADGYFPSEVKNALDHATTYNYDVKTGQPSRESDPNGVERSFTFDEFGRLVQASRTGEPLTYQRRFWCTSSCPESAVYWIGTYRAGAPESRQYFDEKDREIASKVRNFADTGFNTVLRQFDARGNLIFESVPHADGDMAAGALGTRYLDHDVLSRVGQKTMDQSDGGVFVTDYDYDSFKTSITAGALEMHRTYNGLQQLIETYTRATHQPSGSLQDVYTKYAYDGAGNAIVIEDPNGNSLEIGYNGFGFRDWVDDPNSGLRSFTYTVWGEVKTETDGRLITITTEYDQLGRTTERQVDGAWVGRWYYDNTDNWKGLGLLDYEVNNGAVNDDSSSLTKRYYYDTNTRKLVSTRHEFGAVEISAPAMDTYYLYDSNYGRQKAMIYPGGLTVEQRYSATGYLSQELDGNSGNLFRSITAMNVRNQPTDFEVGYGAGRLTVDSDFHPATGQIERFTALKAAVPVLELGYIYDQYGNLYSQTQSGGGQWASEVFAYDELHRLIQSNRTFSSAPAATVNFGYDAAGNITLRDDFWDEFSYAHPSLPNAISSARMDGQSVAIKFQYDENGNQVRGRTGVAQYDAFNKPIHLSDWVQTYFSYGADLQRYRQANVTLGEYRLYVDKHFEIDRSDDVTKYVHYISDVAIATKTDLTATEYDIRYVHRDRLGSPALITDAAGAIVERRGHGPFGTPRNGDWTDRSPFTLNLFHRDGAETTDRGFTDHEHVDWHASIHMNGRWYDYVLGRFASVDPIIRDPGNSQSLNPYSYVMNNPLAYTDPSGYCAAETGTRIKHCVDVNVNNVAGETIATKSLNIQHSNFKVHATSFAAGVIGESLRNMNLGGLEQGNTTDILSQYSGPILASTNQEEMLGDGDETQRGDGFGVDDGLSLGVGLTPAGTIADVYTAVSGEDFFTEEEISGFWRWAGIIPWVSELRKGGKVLDALPVLDRTGKVHGALPRVEDLSRYDPTELRQLQRDLRRSVQERIRKTSELGPDRAHGQRQAAEQQLIIQIEKFLSGS